VGRTRRQKNEHEEGSSYRLREGGVPLRGAGFPVVDALPQLAADAVADEGTDVARRHDPCSIFQTISHVGAAIGYGSAAGTAGFALGPLWGGSLSAASSAPGSGVLGKGRLFFLVLALLAALNSQLAFSLPPWPEDKSPWRYLLRCRSSSLQDLSSSGTLLY